MKAIPTFKTRARVINQLGEQLIKNESIALLELIKNSYDADASRCDVIMKNPESTTTGEIVVSDNGEGMSYDTLVNIWLEIGTSNKEDLKKGEKTARTKKGRMRLGEKGIGRLGAHRLGRKIEIITCAKGQDEVVLEIDWDSINNSLMIEDIPVTITKRHPVTFVNTTGTIIAISKLRVPWTRAMARECARTITSLNSPFESCESFSSTFKIKGSKWLDGLLTFNDIKEYKLFSFDIELEGNAITSFSYEFTPWPTMTKLQSRTVNWDKNSVLSRLCYKEDVGPKTLEVDLSRWTIGKVRFNGFIFDRDSKTLSMGVQDKAGLKEYLDYNGGVRVFRDNMRVLDYGEPSNDWLGLSSRRVNRPGVHISNSVILAAVYLDRDSSEDLIEKANREGFIENNAYLEFYKAIGICLTRIESERRTDKDLLRKHYGPQETQVPVVSSIAELKEIVEKSVKEPATKEKINICLDRIESEYENMTDSLIRSAGAGLNLIMVIHQIEKIIKDVREMLKKRAANNIVEERVATLSSLVEGYSILVKSSEKKERNLKGIIEQSAFNIEFRLEAHGISLEPAFRRRNKNTDGICSENHVLNALLNIFDNSIWWLGYAKTVNPSIFMDISDAYSGYTSIVIADNGPGFTKPTSEIIKPFVSDKPGGMGIGLHLTDQIMKALGGELLFPGMDIFDIPTKYAKGAIVALAFAKKEEK